MAGVAKDSPLDRRLVVDNANIMSRKFSVTNYNALFTLRQYIFHTDVYVRFIDIGALFAINHCPRGCG